MVAKNRRPYNLYCVGADVKPCSINQSAYEVVLIGMSQVHNHSNQRQIKTTWNRIGEVLAFEHV